MQARRDADIFYSLRRAADAALQRRAKRRSAARKAARYAPSRSHARMSRGTSVERDGEASAGDMR